ncbi:MAG: MerR family DNA-binding transcriptional regulator, partial [Betaproteobacteria bacterium]
MRAQGGLENLTIGGFAKACGVHVETVRFYQRRCLLRPPDRPAHPFRITCRSIDFVLLRFVRFHRRTDPGNFWPNSLRSQKAISSK